MGGGGAARRGTGGGRGRGRAPERAAGGDGDRGHGGGGGAERWKRDVSGDAAGLGGLPPRERGRAARAPGRRRPRRAL